MKDEPTHPSLATAKGRWTENYSSYATVAEVEVDTETGLVKILKATTAHDCGFPLNPTLVEGQIDGQVSMGQGHMLTEELRVEQGCVINPSFLEYKMPCALDMVETDYIDVITEKYQKDRHYNTKEVGEGYVSGTVAAVANAVYNATGVRLKQTPFSPDRVLDGLEQTSKEKGRIMGRWLENVLQVVTKILDAIGGAALTLMMLLTVADVLMRAAGHPLVGTYEIVALSLALVIGFTIPKVSFDRGHVRVDLVLEKISKRNRDLLNIFTRLVCIGLFILIGYQPFQCRQ